MFSGIKVIEGAGGAQLGENKAQGGPYYYPQLPERRM